jgi:hypothetical protein
MRRTFDPFRLLLVSIAGWLGQQQRDAIDYLREENRVLREQLGDKRLRLSDDQRRRLALVNSSHPDGEELQPIDSPSTSPTSLILLFEAGCTRAAKRNLRTFSIPFT